MAPARDDRAGSVRRWPFAPKSPDEARQGETAGLMRWVLGVSIVMIIAAFGTLYAYTALFTAHQ